MVVQLPDRSFGGLFLFLRGLENETIKDNHERTDGALPRGSD